MNGLVAYQVFTAMSLHFNDNVDYDGTKYNMKTKVNEKTFSKKPKKWMFAGFEKNVGTDVKSLASYYYPTFSTMNYVNPKIINKKLLDRNQKELYNELYKYKEGINILSSKLKDDGKQPLDLFKQNDMYPLIYEYYKDGHISYLTLQLIDALIVKLDSSMSSDIIGWPTTLNDLDRTRNILMFYVLDDEFKKNFKDYFVFKILQNDSQ